MKSNARRCCTLVVETLCSCTDGEHEYNTTGEQCSIRAPPSCCLCCTSIICSAQVSRVSIPGSPLAGRLSPPVMTVMDGAGQGRRGKALQAELDQASSDEEDAGRIDAEDPAMPSGSQLPHSRQQHGASMAQASTGLDRPLTVLVLLGS